MTPTSLFALDLALAACTAAVGYATGRKRAKGALAQASAEAEKQRVLAEQRLRDMLKAEGALVPLRETLRRNEAALTHAGAAQAELQASLDRSRADNAQMTRHLATAMTGRETAETALSDLRFRWDHEHPPMVRGPDGKFLGRADRVQAAPGQATGASQNALEEPVEVPTSPCAGQEPQAGAGKAEIQVPVGICFPGPGLPAETVFGYRPAPPTIPVHAVGDPDPARPDGVAMQRGEG